MLLHGGETLNVEKPSDNSSSQHRVGGFPGPGGNHGPGYLRNPEGRALSALNRFGENARMISQPSWLQRIQQQQSIMEPPSNFLYRIHNAI